MYPPVPCEVVANSIVSTEHTLGTADVICSGIWGNSSAGRSACYKAFQLHATTQMYDAPWLERSANPPISVLEWGKAIQVTGLLHTKPPHRILQLYWTLFSAFFVFRFSTMAKMTMTDVCIGTASVAHLCTQGSIRNDHVILVNFITPILPGAWSGNRNMYIQDRLTVAFLFNYSLWS
jgi:hypothetical protein